MHFSVLLSTSVSQDIFRRLMLPSSGVTYREDHSTSIWFINHMDVEWSSQTIWTSWFINHMDVEWSSQTIWTSSDLHKPYGHRVIFTNHMDIEWSSQTIWTSSDLHKPYGQRVIFTNHMDIEWFSQQVATDDGDIWRRNMCWETLFYNNKKVH
jgi:hypothetical protein